jgi:hypothetical protein
MMTTSPSRSSIRSTRPSATIVPTGADTHRSSPTGSIDTSFSAT